MSSNLPPGVTQSMIDPPPDIFELFENSNEFAALDYQTKDTWADLMEWHFDLLNTLVVFAQQLEWENNKVDHGMWIDLHVVPNLINLGATDDMIRLVQGREGDD